MADAVYSVELSGNDSQLTVALERAARSADVSARRMQSAFDSASTKLASSVSSSLNRVNEDSQKTARHFDQLRTSANTAMEQPQQAVGRLSDSLSGMASKLGMVALASSAMFATFAGAKFAVQTAASMEQLHVQLNFLEKDAQKGAQAFNHITTMATQTPFKINEVTAAYVQLKNFGIDPMNGALQAALDMSAKSGKGAEGLKSITLALGQAWSKGKLQGDDILQLINASVPVWDILATVTGKNVEQLHKLSEKGALGREAITAMIAEMGHLSAGASAAQMDTLAGAWSNLGDAVTKAADKLNEEGTLKPLQNGLIVVTDQIQKLSDNGTLNSVAAGLTSDLKTTGSALSQVGETVAEYRGLIGETITALIALKAAQSASSMADSMRESVNARVAAIRAARENAEADLAAANASQLAARQAVRTAEAEKVLTAAELDRTRAAVQAAEASMADARAKAAGTGGTVRMAEAEAALRTALDARSVATGRAAAATEVLNAANIAAANSAKITAAAQLEFERTTTLAGLAARGFGAALTAMGGPLGIAMIALIEIVQHWKDVAEWAGIAGIKSEQAALRIKKALAAGDTNAIRGELDAANADVKEYGGRVKTGKEIGDSPAQIRTYQEKLDAALDRKNKAEAALREAEKREVDAVVPGSYANGLDRQAGLGPKPSAGTGAPVHVDVKDPDKKAKAAPSRMGEWEAELGDDKVAYAKKHDLREIDAADEIKFWQGKLAIAREKGGEKVAIERKIGQLQLSELRKQRVQNQQLGLEAIESRKSAALEELAITEEGAQQKFDLGQISHQQLLQQLQAFEQRQYEIERQALTERLALLEKDPSKNPAELARIHQQIEVLEMQHRAKLRKLARDEQKDQAAPGMTVFKSMETSFSTALTNMMTRAQTWRQALGGMFKSLHASFVQEMVTKPLAEWAMSKIRMLVMESGFLAKLFGLQAAGAASTVSLKAGEATAVVSANSAEAASGAAAAVAPTPFIGPVLAAAAFAGIMAMTMGAMSNIKSARGGYDIPAGVNPMTQLHEQEMVLPKQYANVIRGLAAGGFDQGMPSVAAEPSQQFNFHIHAVDAHSVKRLFHDHGSALVSALKAQGRNFAGG